MVDSGQLVQWQQFRVLQKSPTKTISCPPFVLRVFDLAWVANIHYFCSVAKHWVHTLHSNTNTNQEKLKSRTTYLQCIRNHILTSNIQAIFITCIMLRFESQSLKLKSCFYDELIDKQTDEKKYWNGPKGEISNPKRSSESFKRKKKLFTQTKR